MEEKAGLLKSLEVLGDKIIGLESDLDYERVCKNQLARDVERLKAENVALDSKLNEVKQYIENQTEGKPDA